MKKCLIVVDYQNDFVDGALGFESAVNLEQRIAAKITFYRDNSDDIIFTFDTHNTDYMQTQEGRNLPVPHCIAGTAGHNLYGTVADLILATDKAFCKNTFGSDELFDYLRQMKYETIELAGVVSNICVIANAVLAKTAQPESQIIVDSRCVASNDDKLNAAALEVMRSLQIKIV